ncbi:MAG: hypothetical protein HY515_04920 [Candidatus Aenigmarchaeota archaeon]|nr:hypothetical protein [Candidatus Aenigmarchaeota archaeon]
MALAIELKVSIKNIEELTKNDTALVIQAVPETPEILLKVTALASKKSKLAISFAFHTSTYADSRFNPNVIGLDTGGATLPWKRGGFFDLSLKNTLLWIFPIKLDTYRKLRKIIGPLVKSKGVQAKPLERLEEPQTYAAHISQAMHDAKRDAYESHVKYCSKYFTMIKQGKNITR